ncbi:hypothetical protein LJR168_001524 [Pseudoxanthomonas sp. LjRoot168]|uniref:hypothetical protein n=1 Tax=unclassified Pseudoxanthomonas TaxID=2645906 RepID=UPI003ECCDDB2
MGQLALYLGVWAVGVLLAGLGVMLCWNASLAYLFPAVPRLGYGRALALMLLCWLLFGAGAIGLTYTLGF